MKTRKSSKVDKSMPDSPMDRDAKIVNNLPGITTGNYSFLDVPDGRYDEELHRYTITSCYLGAVAAFIQDKEEVKIPFKLVWPLFYFIGDLNTKNETIILHKRIIEKAFNILGYKAEVEAKDHLTITIRNISKIAGRAEIKMDDTFDFSLKGLNRETLLSLLCTTLIRDREVLFLQK